MTRCLLGFALAVGAAAGARGQYPPGFGGYNNGGVPGYNGNQGYGAFPQFGGAPGYGFPPAGGVGPGGFPGGPGQVGGPLSPYLNLLGRNNAAVNYYQFTRPGTIGNQTGVGGFGRGLPNSQLSQGFVPLAAFSSETPTEFPPIGPQTYLPSEAHAVQYGNRFGPLAGTLPTGPNNGLGGGGRNGFTRSPFGQQGGSGQGTGQGQGAGQGSGSAPSAPRTR